LINRFHLYPKADASGAVDDALNQLRSDVEVNPSGPEQVSGKVKTVSFTLKYTGRLRKTAADVTNAIASFYVQQNDSMRSQSAWARCSSCGSSWPKRKGQLDRQDAAITQYTTSYTGQLPQQVGINLATLERMNTQLRLNGEQQLRLIEQREKLVDGLQDPNNIARAENPDATPEMIERLKQIEKLRATWHSCRRRFTSKHPDVVRLQDQMADLEQQQKQDEGGARQEAAGAAAAAARQGPGGRRRAGAAAPDHREP
jgi:hypothetical protein